MPAGICNTAHAENAVVQAAGYVAHDNVDPGVQQVSYTVSQTGHRYKWMPYQPKPTKKVEPLRAEAAQFTAPAQTTPLHPIQDPFGDSQQAAQDQALPSVEQLLADDNAKEVPLEDLLSPPLANGELPAEAPFSPDFSIDQQGDPQSIEGMLADRRPPEPQECKSPDEVLDPIDDLDYNTAIRDPQLSDPELRPTVCDLAGGEFVPRQWAPTTFMWQASGLCHKPAYFEDVHLERYGHSWGPYVQPLMSGAHFFLNVPILPYKMGLDPPNECIYTLGYYRPGSCAPYMLDPLPLSVRAGLAQAGAVVGLGYLIP